MTRGSQRKTPVAYLVPVPAETFTHPVRLEHAETTIGRDTSNSIRLAHGAVSRSHAKISRVGDQYVLTDLQSRNGTFVNRTRARRAVLNSGDTIYFGNRAFLFKLDREAPSPDPEQPLSIPATVTITEDADIDPTDLVAREADLAIHTFLHPSEAECDQSDPSSVAHQRLYLLYQLSEQVRSGGEPDEVLSRGLDLIFQAVPAAEHAVALLREEETTGPLEVRAVRFRNPAKDGGPIPISRTVLDWVMTEGVALVSRDALDDSRFESSESIRVHNLKSIICVPMMIDRRVVGAVHLDTGDFLNPLTAFDMEFVAAVGNEIAVWIENHRLQRNAIRNERMAAIGVTVTNVAHNLKNLLHMSMNAVALMDQRLEVVKDERIHTRWHLVRRCLERMNRLAADMLEFSRIEPSPRDWIDVNSALHDNRELFEKQLRGAGIELVWDLAPGLPRCLLDAIQLQRAVLNLVVNAEDALKDVPDGRIVISTSMDDHGRLNVSISDNGCGIPSGEFDKIFQLFYTTKGSDGSGLGLPMVQKFVKAVNGRIEVESEPGKGSAFRLVFSRTFEEPPRQAVPQA
ncbi:MAG: FHA domain-containing protein [Deltaproteobacteria bacterium]|nr:FHA domain-containing protein [Deltaproteobacteria bacterium]